MIVGHATSQRGNSRSESRKPPNRFSQAALAWLIYWRRRGAALAIVDKTAEETRHE
jgi:hypothetical protein